MNERMLRALALLVLLPAAGFGQQLSHPVMASRDDLFLMPRPFLLIPDTVEVLAVMAQFQTDQDVATTGEGRFDLSAATDSIIDAPPHNGQFFDDHMTFLENYYSKSSDGKQIIRTTFIDTVYTLSGPMADYSPQRNESNLKLAELAKETWEMVDASGRVSDFSVYDCFLIFHAGTGRDIDLVSLFGFDPTPRDVPSIFLGPAAFREAYGQDYPGILVNNGQDTISNSGILPETESRLIPTVTGDILLELSFNGLLSASVASYLGLPDLFDTNTGFSAIGRFGLMDGQSIFSFLGVFPPEPSAWEKYYLGWVEPLTVAEAETSIQLPAVGLGSADTIYRAGLTPGEYFLIENRQRDPLGNGQVVTSVFNGVTRTQVFPVDTTGFNQFDISALSGVITDVEDLDWSLPGGIDVDGNRLNGGALIWHIDEAIIQREIGSNSVNADPDHRGVDLEEADGSQDIGQEYGFLSPGSGSEEGTVLDFWYDGNPAPVFENVFSSTSFPSSVTNSGANSLITINQFSASGAKMSATVLLGDGQTLPLDGYPMALDEVLPLPSLTVGSLIAGGAQAVLATSTGKAVPVFSLEGDSTVAPPVAGKVFGWTATGSPGMTAGFSDGRMIEGANMQEAAFLETAVAVRDLNGDSFQDILVAQGRGIGSAGGGAAISSLRAFTPVDSNGDSLAETLFETVLPRRLTTPPVIADSVIAVGATGGILYLFRFDGVLIDSVIVLSAVQDSVAGVSLLSNPYSFVVTGSGGSITVVTRAPDNSTLSEGIDGIDLDRAIAGPGATSITTVDGTSTMRLAVTTRDGNLYYMVVTGVTTILPGFPVSTGAPCTAPPALADIDGDGERDVIFFSGSQIHVYNHVGAVLDNFPVTVASGAVIASSPVVADVDGDDDLDIVAVTEDGLVTAFDRFGDSATGFPLQAGSGRQSAAVFQIPGPSLEAVDVGLIVASSDDGSVTGWKTGRILANSIDRLMPWPQFQRDATKSGLATELITGSKISNSFFPEDRAYNWPNPVYDARTYFRFFVSEDAQVSVKIFDLAGDLVSELSTNAVGGVDNEIAWDVTDIQSGVYFARMEASGSTGSGNTVIKVAVVK